LPHPIVSREVGSRSSSGIAPAVEKGIERPPGAGVAPWVARYCTEAMLTLRRTLYVQAAVWSLIGVALATVPRFVLSTVFGQSRLVGDGWIRVIGIQAFGLALFMVLVGHRIQDSWWWSWGFTLVTSALAAVALLNAAFGLAPGDSSVPWWLFGGISVAFAFGLLYGLYQASGEQPIP
jgi:hypothetical protein